MAKEKKEMLTAKKFAERAGITYPTVMAWLRKGLIPGAKLMEESPLGSYWQIPVDSLGKVERQKTGPKPKGNEFPFYREAYKRCRAVEGWDSMPEEEKIAELDRAYEESIAGKDCRRFPRPPANPAAYLSYMRDVLRDFEKGSDQ